jgi:hypothetical protein
VLAEWREKQMLTKLMVGVAITGTILGIGVAIDSDGN